MPPVQTYLSLAAGIGGFDLASSLANNLQSRCHFKPIAFCEKDIHCQKLLAHRFPNVPIFPDIVKLSATDLAESRLFPDGIVSGLPCQPFSQASATRKGSADERNLFPHFIRLLRAVRPRWAIVENVPGLLTANSGQFFRDFLRETTKIGYDCRWQIISCADVGGVHLRERIWIILFANCS